jgi:hypothetical protein
VGFVAEYEAAAGWYTEDASTSTVTCAEGDVLVASAVCGNQLRALGISDTAALGGLTWALKGSVSATARCSIAQWTATVGAGQGGTFDITATFSGDGFGGLSVLRFEDVDVGAHASGDAADPAAPSLDIGTTEDDSIIVVVVGDHETVDGSTRTWRTGAGALTELAYFRSNSETAVYLGYYADADAAGTKTVGLTQPNTMRPSIAAVELTLITEAPERTGSGAFASPSGSVDGAGSVTVTGDAGFATITGDLAATGAVTVSGAGVFESSSPVLDGAGAAAISGAAAFISPAGELFGRTSSLVGAVVLPENVWTVELDNRTFEIPHDSRTWEVST